MLYWSDSPRPHNTQYIYIKYMPYLVHTCIHCIIDMNYEQNDGGYPLTSVFHLDRGFTSLGYNLFHH